MSHVWIDGRVVPAARARVGVLDRAVQYGFGLFETIRVHHGAPLFVEEHVARMRASAKRFGLRIPPTVRGIRDGLRRLAAREGLAEGMARVVLTAGTPATLFATVWSIRDPVGRGVRVELAPASLRSGYLAGHKTLNYLANRLAREEAMDRGVFELLLADRGRVLEGTVSNVFAVRRGIVTTPPLGAGILPGVTRVHVIQLLRRQGMRIREAPLTVRALLASDGVFLTNAIVHVVPILRLGRRRWPVGSVTRRLAEAYRRLAEAEAARR